MSSSIYSRDQRLVDACVAGSPESWDEFLAQYRRLVRSTVVKVCGSGKQRHEQEDIEAHVYEKLLEDECRRMRLWRRRARFSTYLVQVTRNLTLDYLNKGGKKPHVEPFDEHHDIGEPEPSFDGELNDLRLDALKWALEKLPPRQSIIIQMRLEGKSLRGIAEALNRPAGTVSVENSRAMEKLREILRRSHPDLREDGEAD
jgi:RNA polymerase sigma-70 factor (ECF subfamily)